jgi:hypothetical protein
MVGLERVQSGQQPSINSPRKNHARIETRLKYLGLTSSQEWVEVCLSVKWPPVRVHYWRRLNSVYSAEEGLAQQDSGVGDRSRDRQCSHINEDGMSVQKK